MMHNDNLDWYIVRVWNSQYVHTNKRLEQQLKYKYLVDRWINKYIPGSKLLRLTYVPEIQ